MPAKIREKDRDRDKERDRTRDKETDGVRLKEKSRHRSSKSTRKSSSKDVDDSPVRPERSATITTPPNIRKNSLPKPELERRSSSNPPTPYASKTSLPYPSFSKAHSKEAVRSREDVVNARLSYYTPDPTDLDKRKERQAEQDAPISSGAAPPSPPLTTDPVPLANLDREMSPYQSKSTPRKTERKKTDLEKAAEKLKQRLGRGGYIGSDREHTTRSASFRSSRADGDRARDDDGSVRSERRSKPSTPSKSRPKEVTVEDVISTTSLRKSTSPPPSNVSDAVPPAESTTASDATSIAPNQPSTQQPTPQLDTQSTLSDDSPKTPTLENPHFIPSRNETPASILNDHNFRRPSVEESPMPPPPPPPPTVPFHMPKVDYLMQNGGLPQAVSRSLLSAGEPPLTADQPVPPASAQVERFFSPFNHLLDDYVKVMARSGSLAVATGYRSIARRLLDRLEAVFARNISSETCSCIICQVSPQQTDDEESGVSWGEILEYVCGRQDLPQWPPFVLDSAQVGLGISATSKPSPMQNLDIDVPEEYREHYVRQSRKTKQAVDRWLDNQPTNPTSPPQDIDDETLTFAMLTRLDPDQRPIFSSLIGVTPTRPASRVATSTPLGAPPSPILAQTSLAIQRLYRLNHLPRDPESAIYLLTNPALHNILATLAAISDHEWEILISGRFDGFLRSGADDVAVPNNNTSFTSLPSRGTTPFSRAPTPATLGAPVSLDEETELAALAEIEREIYTGMEALEDAFEALHGKAETVRNCLRQRAAGLAVAVQVRRGDNGTGDRNLDARLGTPAWESETDDGIGEESELWPDDSASCISTRRRGRGRRYERRTPALREEDEDGEEGR
ncbi:MAG: hypothetical protein Q9220_006246 [cf. Caloplaca sp. 1 TL-2023]